MVLWAVAAAGGCSAPAREPASAPAEEAVAPAAGGDFSVTEEYDPIVCRWEVPTGSRISKRTCLRSSQRALMQRDARQTLDDEKRRGTRVVTPTSD
jgi:hypothetical protein